MKSYISKEKITLLVRQLYQEYLSLQNDNANTRDVRVFKNLLIDKIERYNSKGSENNG